MRRISWSRILVIGALVCIVVAFVLLRMDAPEPQGDVYAYVGSEPVYREALERSYSQRNPTQENLSLDEYFEETYAPRTMLLLEAEALNLTVTTEEVDGWVMMINSTLQSQNVSFDMYLEDLNVTYEELRVDIRESTLLDKVLETLVAREVMVTAEEIEAAYVEKGYEALGIPLEDARNEIGPALLREKQDARLRELVEELRERYDISYA